MCECILSAPIIGIDEDRGSSELVRGQAQMPEVVPHLQEKEQVPMED